MTHTEILRMHLEIESEGERSPAQTDPVAIAEALLETKRFQLVMRMTARGFARLSEVEKRNYARWAEHFAKVFAEKAAMFRRNSKPEPETPEYLQSRVTAWV